MQGFMPIMDGKTIWLLSKCNNGALTLANWKDTYGVLRTLLSEGICTPSRTCTYGVLMVANKPLKQKFKQQYCSYKTHADPGPGGKYKLHHDTILLWLRKPR
jgi:hypothetical protein